MAEIVAFIIHHKFFSVAFLAINIAILKPLIQRVLINTSKYANEARGTGRNKKTLFAKVGGRIRAAITPNEEMKKKPGIYMKAKDKVRKAGFNSGYAVTNYLAAKYIAPAVLFTIGFILNYPNIVAPLVYALFVIAVTDAVIYRGRRNMNIQFQKYIYKIYMNLHNQISSGVKVTDAVKSVYQIIEDKHMKDILILLSARYELTLDIDYALEEFMKNFDSQEAETLAIAIKQGIETGDNRELLEMQEGYMFDKYFSYIQAETNSCELRSFIAASIFVVIIVVMVFIPTLGDATNGFTKIFSN